MEILILISLVQYGYCSLVNILQRYLKWITSFSSPLPNLISNDPLLLDTLVTCDFSMSIFLVGKLKHKLIFYFDVHNIFQEENLYPRRHCNPNCNGKLPSFPLHGSLWFYCMRCYMSLVSFRSLDAAI